MSCHQNWNPWFHACLEAIGRGEIGQLTTLISQQILGDHNAGLFRLFIKSSPVWVMASRTDRGRAGIIGFENGIHGIVTPGGWQYLQIVGTEGWIDVRNEYREFEMWRRWPIDETREMTSAYNHPLVVPPARVQFPNPRVPQSSQTASIDTLVENH